MIEEYLNSLKTRLAGADPAIVQDALYDAEEYLRNETASMPAGDEEAAWARIVESYGTPEEVAAAYLDTEVKVAAALKPVVTRVDNRGPLAKFFGILADPQAWGAAFYLLLSLVTGIVYFTIVVTGLSLSAGLSILIVGVPMMLAFLAIVRAISLAEGRVVEGLLGERMPRRPRLAPARSDLWGRIKWWLTDYRTWTTMLYMALQLPLGITYFTTIVTGAAVCASLIAAPVAQLVTGQPMFIMGSYGYLIEPWAAPLVMAVGALGFVLMLHIIKLVGRLHAGYAKVMLVGNFSENR
ncbi:MAG: sensor domain-containing protein [Actinomycetota bacterium]|nr:sensor domain-containing protein [Actinomycetota bacterium]